MGLLASPAVKSLNKQAGEIGSLIGQAGMGMLSESDVADIVANDERRQQLRELVRSVSVEVGDDKATKMAVKAARKGAEPWVRNSQPNIRHCYDQAEEAIRSMLGR
jgi:hypothetical protein